MRKPDFCLCEKKGADQLYSNCTADQRLCFCYADSIIPLLLKSKISSFYLSSAAAQAGLCRTLSQTPRHGSYELCHCIGDLCNPFYVMTKTGLNS